mmetsp:Transcript_27888/g.30475  ORF Transcript_27888/g.30475 Transcript_27888/m.30475 type:complete len:271 (+) Transcript_27888:63-875(+)
MKFRPCIDLHQGKVKQIVGSTLTENDEEKPVENFVASQSAIDFARRYDADQLFGGHVIMLDKHSEVEALAALSTFPQGLQIGGGITIDNADLFLRAGASHVIITSYVFNNGSIDFSRLEELSQKIGKDKLVLDLSCRRKPPSGDDVAGAGDDRYYVVTNKWTKFTDFAVTRENLLTLTSFCDEFLVHGVDVEGKRGGIELDLVRLLGDFASDNAFPITYAGGIRSVEDLELVRREGKGAVDCTIGSALDCFGGDLSYQEVLHWHNQQNPR